MWQSTPLRHSPPHHLRHRLHLEAAAAVIRGPPPRLVLAAPGAHRPHPSLHPLPHPAHHHLEPGGGGAAETCPHPQAVAVLHHQDQLSPAHQTVAGVCPCPSARPGQECPSLDCLLPLLHLHPSPHPLVVTSVCGCHHLQPGVPSPGSLPPVPVLPLHPSPQPPLVTRVPVRGVRPSLKLPPVHQSLQPALLPLLLPLPLTRQQLHPLPRRPAEPVLTAGPAPPLVEVTRPRPAPSGWTGTGCRGQTFTPPSSDHPNTASSPMTV